MKKLDTSENQVKPIYLGVGSNLGNKKINIEKAKFKLADSGIFILQSSKYFESLSWPNTKNPTFLNIILEVTTNLKSAELLKVCKNLESYLGRKKSPKNSPRVCDIDIIDYKSQVSTSNVVLPHPIMHVRNFVLLPLFELNKDWIHPISKHHIKKLIFLLSNKDIRSIKQI